jgi:hypothetical protein
VGLTDEIETLRSDGEKERRYHDLEEGELDQVENFVKTVLLTEKTIALNTAAHA